MANCPLCGKSLAKTHEQRKLFHTLCKKIGDHIGLSLRQVKEAIKEDFFGVDEYEIAGKKYYRVTSSEEPNREGYTALIEFTYMWAAERCYLSL